MAGFFKMMLRMNSNMMGIVTGSDFRNGNLPSAYIGHGEKADKKTKLLIYGEKIDDFVFGKEDVASCTVMQQECHFKMGGNQQKIGPKYEIKFKNGKTAIVCVPANAAYLIEQIVM